MGRTGYVFRPCLPKHIAYCKRYSDLVSPNVSLIMGGAASLQTSKGSIFDPFASGVLLQLRHLSSFLYIIYTANFTRGQKGDLFEQRGLTCK